MHRLLDPIRTASQCRRQYNVLVLAALLCFWIVAAAAHAHEQGDVPHGGSSHCAVCVMLPSAAPAPTTALLLLPSLVFGRRLLDATRTVLVLSVPASYQSRAPPLR